MVVKLAFAGFLLAHGLIHTGYLTRRPATAQAGPPWPFRVESSWLGALLGMGRAPMRLVATGLTAATIAGFSLAAVAALGFLPTSFWVTGTSIGAVSSLLLLGIFFHPWLLIGLVIDVALLWAVVIARWAPGP